MKKIILDADTGIDDALAILYALGSNECELIGITSIYGNVSVDTSVENSLSILDLVEHQNIPVYKGAEAKLGSDTYERREITKKSMAMMELVMFIFQNQPVVLNPKTL